jgi:SAM-dependent methyltransferase
VGPLLTRGNTAKLYCLQLLDDSVSRAKGEFRIVDLGCGDGRNFVELLERYSNLCYVGIDASRASVEQARRRLPRAEIVHASAYGARLEPADAVISFSVLEHVADRPRYMEAVRANLAPAGRAYLNYDSGHFGADATPVERVKAAVARLLGRAGHESRYRAVVRDEEFAALIASMSLRVTDDKGFNTDLKLTYRAVPETQSDVFMERWLAFELELNARGLTYDERIFRTRNVVLEHPA